MKGKSDGCSGGRGTRREWIISSVIGATFLWTFLPSAFGQGAKPSGTVTIHQVQVAFIGSGSGGSGILRFQGRNYPFTLGGLGIGGIGISRLDATGTVYNLTRLEDFNGVYG